MVEYILLVALIALAVIGAVTFLSQQTDSKFQDAGNQIKAAGDTPAAPCGTATVIGYGSHVQSGVPGMIYFCNNSTHVFVPN